MAPNPIEGWRRQIARSLRRERDGRRTTSQPHPFLRRLWMGRRLGIGRLAVVAGVIWMVVSLVAGEHGFLTVRGLKAEHQRLEEEIATLETELDRISTRLRETSADPYELETIAREEYGLAQPGETVYRIEDGESLPGDTPPPSPDASVPAGVDTDTGGR